MKAELEEVDESEAGRGEGGESRGQDREELGEEGGRAAAGPLSLTDYL